MSEYYFYQTMFDFPKQSRKIAKELAKGLATLEDESAQRQMLEELGAILGKRNELRADVESLANIYKGNSSGAEFVDSSREMCDYYCRDLDAIFIELCRTFGAEGLTLTGGQISALKRKGLPDPLAKELDAIKGESAASIPEAERLGGEICAALHEELTRLGLISGPYSSFAYYLGEIAGEKRKKPAEDLKWTGTKAEFAYFARLFADATQPRGMGKPYIREKALCRAFGFTEKQMKNTIRQYIRDECKPRTSTKMEAAFAAALAASTPKEQ